MVNDKLKIFEIFSGFGGASFALKKAEIDFECVGFSEIDKYAIQCYEQNHKISEVKIFVGGFHNERVCKNFGDCTKINPNDIPDFDLLTGGFPCQAFSVAGKGKGELDTRGTLFNEIIRIAEVKQPKYMLLENVKGLTNKKHERTFNKILSELRRIGYHVDWKILNSKDYGIPQNRERVWFVCFREDLFENSHPLERIFCWPGKEELKIFLKDILEDEVDDKYYLKQNQVNNLIKNNNMNCNPSGNGMNGKVHYGDIAPTITINKGEGNKIIQLNNPKHSNNRVYSKEGISPTLRDMSAGGNRQPFIQTCQAVITPDRINKSQNGRRFKTDGESSFTLNTQDRHGVLLNGLTIRKLTPKECFRLMGFLNDEINLDGISNSQRYKLCGNGWEINVVSKIFKNMLK